MKEYLSMACQKLLLGLYMEKVRKFGILARHLSINNAKTLRLLNLPVSLAFVEL